MVISAVIPTYKREELLAEAVASVLGQNVPGASIEVVVVNDAGEPLSHADWQDDPRVLVADTYRTERSVARNTGAALSRGEYLHFLDDDDTLAAGGYEALLAAVGGRENVVLAVGAYQAVSSSGRLLRTTLPVVGGGLFCSLVAGAGIPLGACLVRREAFFRAGGFDPAFTVMEDLDLIQRLVLLGSVQTVDTVVARFRMGRHDLSTTAWERGAEACRAQREKAFGTPGCLARLRQSLRCSDTAIARGCLVRFYAGSAYRHARRGRIGTAAQRLGAAMWLAISGVPCKRFWRGIRGTLPQLGRSSLPTCEAAEEVSA